MKISIRTILELGERVSGHITKAGQDIFEKGVEIRSNILSSVDGEFVPYVGTVSRGGKEYFFFQKENPKRNFTDQEKSIIHQTLRQHGFTVRGFSEQESEEERYIRAAVSFV